MGSVTFNDSLKIIGESAFENCTWIDGTLLLPKNINSIGNSAFASCSEINEVIFNSENIDVIRDGTFKNCIGLTKVMLPDSIVNIGNSAFASCSLLENINIPKSLESIGKEAFFSTSLTNLEFAINKNRTVKCIIKDYAFDGCSLGKNDDELIIPDYIYEIGYCSLTQVLYKPNEQGIIYSKKADGCNLWCLGDNGKNTYTNSKVIFDSDTYAIAPHTFSTNNSIQK